MKTNTHNEQPEEPTIEYLVVEDEFNILNEMFDEIFEQIEKEIRNKS